MLLLLLLTSQDDGWSRLHADSDPQKFENSRTQSHSQPAACVNNSPFKLETDEKELNRKRKLDQFEKF